MPNNFTLKIFPEKWDTPYNIYQTGAFELELTRSGLLTDYTWKCSPGYMGAVSGTAEFDYSGGRMVLTLFSSDWRKSGYNSQLIYAFLYNVTPFLTVGAMGWGSVDLSGYRLKKRLQDKKDLAGLVEELVKVKREGCYSRWEVVQAS